ncbi:MAG TPA: alpha/beta hydrolase [Galbitalea sp.]
MRSTLGRGRSRRIGVVAVLAAAALVLSGCTSWFLPPRATSSPTNENVAADLAPYYHQALIWSACDGGFQCTTAKAPLDWSNPGGASIKLALIRKTASGHRLGSLLVNPGGPGASGYDFVRDSLSFAVDSTLQSSYDIVGFDPRGVGHSTPVKCESSPKQLDKFLFTVVKAKPGSAAWVAQQKKSTAAFGANCLKYTGALLGHVDTVSAARDLDLLRAALGDKKLNYLGYSYGTLLGQVNASLYPTKVGRMVLDGVVDPAVSNFQLGLDQAKSFETDLDNYLKACASSGNCPLTGSYETDHQQVISLLSSLTASPLRNADGRELDGAAMGLAIAIPLYQENSADLLSNLFASVMKGDPKFAFQLLDSYYDRNANGTYSDNSTEANIAIDCLDYPQDFSPATLSSQAAKVTAAAPLLAPSFAYSVGCWNWPFKPTGKPSVITADGAGPILVVGTTRDPATPYALAQAVAGQLSSGHLVTYNGDGHTAYNKGTTAGNKCVNRAVDNYFVSGTVPAQDPEC